MHLYTFTRGVETVSTPASSLHDAILLLPATWKRGSAAGFYVSIRPITDETDYWKARCMALEQQLKSVLGEPHV